MPVFGCSWCSPHAHFFSTGCQDGVVRIFNYIEQTQVYRLVGHLGKSFNTAWSPLIDGLMASGSDDKMINIWQIDLSSSSCNDSVRDIKPIRSLTGHTSYVRALCWNLEHRNILLSGSWDASIRVWDALNGSLSSLLSLSPS